MIGNWQIANLGEPQRYLEYAGAYLQASISTCEQMVKQEAQHTWPNACVVMMLAAHSVELFLKGAILSRSPRESLGHHRLAGLADTYKKYFPESEFEIDVPFRTEYLGMSEAEIEALKKEERVPSILFRYPVKKPGVEWEGIHGFDAEQFLRILHAVRQDHARISAKLGSI